MPDALERGYDSINDYTAVAVQLASPNDIRSWSYGEVKKPETINYRSYRAEKDGLFCERIFGPERDWECSCGKYKGIKYKDIICDRCGVKVTHSKVRRQRFGHLNLAAPVVHIWFFKSMPSRLGNLLGIKSTALQQIVYFQRYVITHAAPETGLQVGEPLTEDAYRNYRARWSEAEFRAEMGAEAVRDLLRGLDLEQLRETLRQELEEHRGKQKVENFTKRLRIVEAFLHSNNRPEWMVMDVLPVIPPDLRPLVPLESGNFATSDLNDLYRRVINRNNRLKKLLDLNAPGVIIRNEKRMLQQAVDALFDNGRCKRPVLGAGNRPLKSLTDMIKGKQGRFRENLLGKRVDYSARSVIVVGPELKLDECGLPKKIALELFQPFIIRKLKEHGHADTIKSAKKILERKDEEVWDVLEEVIQGHPVLLNRAPTLHRIGIQAFYPKLIEGDAITIHPLVCGGFNADFDGDQMAVHLPLSLEAQVEASMMMISTNNIFSPAHGGPIITPDLDIVLGCYYLTSLGKNIKGEHLKTARYERGAFANKHEVLLAFEEGKVGKRARIKLRLAEEWGHRGADGEGQVVIHVVNEKGETEIRRPGEVITTTVGRLIFNDILPRGMPFYNCTLNKGALKRVVSDCYQVLDRPQTVELLDRLKDLGFHEATLAGLSFAATDLKIPENKDKLVQQADKEVSRMRLAYEKGVITEHERYQQVIDIWTRVREKVWRELMSALEYDERAEEPEYVNPIFFMVDSGARGSLAQVGQLAGMRGLMAKPSGEIMETPIKANFREGLRGLEYFSSTHGARKGLADTALKTANSGYLTRKLVEVAQDVVVTMHDCGTAQGISKQAVWRGETCEVSLAEVVRGRVARRNVMDVFAEKMIVRENELITAAKAARIEKFLGEHGKLLVRSPLTCEAELGVCAMCYGMDLSTGELVEVGTAVGVIAAQSVGEPGTQLTMRTFHIGGISDTRVADKEIKARRLGTIKFNNVEWVENDRGENVILNRNAELLVTDERGREIDRHIVHTGTFLKCRDGDKVKPRQVIAEWDPHTNAILTDQAGLVRYQDIIPEETMREEKDTATGLTRRQIIEHRGEHHPQIAIVDPGDRKTTLGLFPIPEKAYLEVAEGQLVAAGTLLAKTSREFAGVQDITGGLPRVTELFEARRPKDPAVLAEIDGLIEFGEKKRNKQAIIIKPEGKGEEAIHWVPQGKQILVRRGDRVRRGDKLVEGPLILQDILRISGEEELQHYIISEIQAVYRSQNVKIDDKHIEILVRQMMRKVQIEDPGDTPFLPTDSVGKAEFQRLNREIIAQGRRPATASPLLLGIARASLQSESWISAASFQETTRVLTEAAVAGKKDRLHGLKENVILGHIIPAGTGFPEYYLGLLKRDEPPALQKAAEEQLQLESGVASAVEVGAKGS